MLDLFRRQEHTKGNSATQAGVLRILAGKKICLEGVDKISNEELGYSNEESQMSLKLMCL